MPRNQATAIMPSKTKNSDQEKVLVSVAYLVTKILIEVRLKLEAFSF